MTEDLIKWEKLFDFMEDNDFAAEDLLAVVCANISKQGNTEYEASIILANEIFDIRIEKNGLLN